MGKVWIRRFVVLYLYIALLKWTYITYASYRSSYVAWGGEYLDVEGQG